MDYLAAAKQRLAVLREASLPSTADPADGADLYEINESNEKRTYVAASEAKRGIAHCQPWTAQRWARLEPEEAKRLAGNGTTCIACRGTLSTHERHWPWLHNDCALSSDAA